MATTKSSEPDRRQHQRFPASQLSGLRAARVKYGESIEVIDLSSGGVLFETAAPLTHQATIVLEFSGPTKSVLIPSRIVRCRSVRSADYTVRSQGACAFKRPLGLKDLVIGAPKFDREAAPTSDEASDAATWQQLIAKCRDGRLLSGYTNDFSPSKSHLHVSPARSTTRTQRVELVDLEALFFLRDADDTVDADRVREDAAPYGRRVALVLPSGEQLTGSTLNYSRHTSGVFVYPVDSDFGVARVFVTPSGIHHLRLL
jgi:hypothetical protein